MTKIFLRDGKPNPLASQAIMLHRQDSYQPKYMEITELVLAGGLKGAEVDCKAVAISFDVVELLRLELDHSAQTSELIYGHKFLCDNKEIANIMLTQDKGKGAVNFFLILRLLNVPCANSYRWCAPCLVYEPLTPDQKDKPKDSLANWIKCAEQVRNLNALKATTVLRNGARHCVVPTRILPDEGQPLKIIQGQDSDAGALEKILKGERRGTPAAEEEAEGKSKSECDSFAEIHTSVLEPPREIIHITTKVALLQQEDLDKLKASCLEFKLAFNASYPGSYP